MSRTYFHSPERESAVYGSERAYASILAQDLTWGLVAHRATSSFDKDRLLKHFYGFEPHWRDKNSHLQHDPYYSRLIIQDELRSFFGSFYGRDRYIEVGENKVDPLDFSLNTAIACGSRPLVLLAKLHGSCEDYAWIDPADCEWFADIIDEGRKMQVMRENAGWEDVADHAREVARTGIGPLVTSYSVCESFPYGLLEPPKCEKCDGEGFLPEQNAAGEDYCPECHGDGRLYDSIYDLPDDVKWEQAVDAMKARQYNRQISPDTMDVGFASGLGLFDLLAHTDNVPEVPPNG